MGYQRVRRVYLASLRCAIISRSWRMQKGLDGHLCTATSAVVDPALLAKVDTNRRVSRCFDLRMSEFVTADAFDENVEPTKRKSRRSLTLKRKTVSTASSCAKKPRKALRPRNGTIPRPTTAIWQFRLFHLALRPMGVQQLHRLAR